LGQSKVEGDPLVTRGGVIFSLIVALGFNLLYGVNSLLGQGGCSTLLPAAIDFHASTVIAERLGKRAFAVRCDRRQSPQVE
jgi:hypothetical protein